jgi:hypothetical protein
MNEALDFQLSCTLTNPEACEKCAFFMGCERKYNLKKQDPGIEYFIVLNSSIIIFPSHNAWEEFIQYYGFQGKADLRTDTYNNIIDLSNKFGIEIIIYN